jgi:hypothetical protein
MSHEIRTPLNAIIGFLRFIDSDNLSPARRQDYVKVINDSSKQLTKIIDDIIDISKIEAQQMTICPISVQLNMMMNEWRVLFESYLKASHKEYIELVLDDSGFIDPNLIYVDTVRLRQIFDNLISNAVKFTEKGYIRFGYRQSAPNQLEFVVEDTGIGLSPDQQGIIFERFRQAELGNNRLYGGTGLGLTISRSLAHLMGGDMWVESIEGAGASFYFTISYLPVAPKDIQILEEAPDEKEKPFTGKTVLMVEPAPLIFNYYERLISATGATVSQVETLKQCCDFISNTSFIDLVIVNATLFDKEDIDKIGCFKSERPNLPVVLVIPEKNEKYKRLVQQKLCSTTIESPVGYAEILKMMEKYAG